MSDSTARADARAARMRVAFVIASLSRGGGAERVVAQLANTFAARRDEVTVITLGHRETETYEIDERVKRIDLGLTGPSASFLGGVRANLGRIRALRRALARSRARVAIAFVDQTNVLTLLATLGSSVRVIVSERIDPRHYPVGRTWRLLRRVLYPLASHVVVQTERVRRWARDAYRPSRVVAIPNPIRIETVGGSGRSDSQRARLRVIGMGRLVHQKGFDILIRAFAACARRHADWDLVILGEGEERAALEAQIVREGLEARITLPGLCRDPASDLRASGIFVLSSRFEGFPNALLEAMACGLPVIAADCDSGPSEIVRNGLDGILIPPGDGRRLAAALDRLMSDEALRGSLAARAPEVLDRFSGERVALEWLRLLHGRDVAATCADQARAVNPDGVVCDPVTRACNSAGEGGSSHP